MNGCQTRLLKLPTRTSRANRCSRNRPRRLSDLLVRFRVDRRQGECSGASGNEGETRCAYCRSQRWEGSKRAEILSKAEEDFLKRPEVKISLPDELKLQLVDDWENITKKGELVPSHANHASKTSSRITKAVPRLSIQTWHDGGKQRSPQWVDEVLKGCEIVL